MTSALTRKVAQLEELLNDQGEQRPTLLLYENQTPDESLALAIREGLARHDDTPADFDWVRIVFVDSNIGMP